MGNGNNALVLQTGSNIVGIANGGGGSNTVTLQGTGTASNPFVNFQTLMMQGTAWNWTGSGTFTTALLQSGTLTLTGTLGASPAVSVSSGATLDLAGVSQTFGNVNNAGTIFTHGAGPGTTLTVANYAGAGGNIVFNTFLGADNSPSDRLVINGGKATGTTTQHHRPRRTDDCERHPGGERDKRRHDGSWRVCTRARRAACRRFRLSFVPGRHYRRRSQ